MMIRSANVASIMINLMLQGVSRLSTAMVSSSGVSRSLAIALLFKKEMAFRPNIAGEIIKSA